ncbi:ABC1 kinase family protein [Streptococcus henryi]|uniref:ABC1 kinase family protein n=1 Tax=Streptococcus henryi TaxID=439219 RepID=UPI00037B0BBE|nr:AarF/UbiB family protein [Streptococcus henryi]
MGNKRLRQIVRVFTSVGLTNFKEKNTPLESQLAPAKLRVAFETLGPSFVKIGQVLSTRSDILPKVYIDELSKLQSDVPPMPKDLVMEAISSELSKPVSEVFSWLSEDPLASGSVAQTHRARLLTGEEVVVKIQRPHLAEIIEEDLAVLMKLSRYFPNRLLPMVDIPEVLRNLKETLEREIDFRNEAQAMQEFSRLNQSVKCVAVPIVYEEYTTEHFIVEEYIDGIPINRYDQIIQDGYELDDIGKKLMLSFIKQVFKDGYFHGDPHPGNLLIYDNKIYFIDFGIMGILEDGMRACLNDILYGFTAQDVDGMTRSILALTNMGDATNKAALAQDVEHILTKYASLDLGGLSITNLLEDLVKVFHKNHLRAPAQFTILEKAALQIEGIFRELAPEIDLMTLAKDYFLQNMGPEMLKQALNKETLLIELFYLLKNGKNIPRELHQFLEQLLNGRLLLTHEFYDFTNRFNQVQKLGNRMILSITFLGLILSASILSNNSQMVFLSHLLFLLSATVLLWLIISIIKNSK